MHSSNHLPHRPHRMLAQPLRSLAGCGLALLCNAALAVPCALGGPAGTEVQRSKGGDVVALPAREVENCVGLYVAQGEAIACTTDNRGRGQCLPFARGSTITAAQLNRSGPVKGAWSSFVDMLKGSQGRVPALSRGSGSNADEGPPLPTGPVMLLQPTLSADFSKHSALRGASAIHLHEGGPNGPRVATLSPQGGTGLPTQQLKPGTSYWWQVVSDQPTLPLSGSFSLLPAADRQQARAALAEVRRTAPKSPAAQSAMWANWLLAQGCQHEARTALRGAGFDVY